VRARFYKAFITKIGDNREKSSFVLLTYFSGLLNAFSLEAMQSGKKRVLSESDIRPRIPKVRYEVLGAVDKVLGAERFLVRCFDGFMRLARIRGMMKRRVWVRVNDIVIVSPWDFQSDTRGDIVYRFRRNQVDWLKKHGLLASSERGFHGKTRIA
jgi:translation initiation factor 1A